MTRPQASRLRRTVGLLAPLLAVAASLAFAASATAIIRTGADGHTISYLPLRGAPNPFAAKPGNFDALFANLDYNGGEVMTSNNDIYIAWDPSGTGDYPSGYISGINQYFTDLAHDSGGNQNVDSVATQYTDANGNRASYSITYGDFVQGGKTYIWIGSDTDPYPASGCPGASGSGKDVCLTDAQIQTEIKHWMGTSMPTGLGYEYFLLLPPGAEVCQDASGSACSANASVHPTFCAYHSDIGPTPQQDLFVPPPETIIYSVDPYVSGNSGCDDGNHPNGNVSDGAIQGGLSHEHNESITDPIPNGAWTDYGSQTGGEIGDKCAGNFGSPLGFTSSGVPYNQVINGHYYWYQQEWSNFGATCKQRLTTAPTLPSASFYVFQSAPGKIDFTASTNAASPNYVWQFNDDVTPGDTPQTNTVETSSPTLTHQFPQPGKYTVALTVMASDGTSRATAGQITALAGPTVTISPPASPLLPGQTGTWTATGTGDAPLSYSWDWGDGTSGSSGPTVQHAYSKAGSYTVKVTVFDKHGWTGTDQQPVSVAAPATASSGNKSLGTGSGATPGGPTAASNHFTLGGVKANKNGSADLTIAVAGPGTVHATGAAANNRVLASLADFLGAAKHRKPKKPAASIVPLTVQAPAAGKVTLHILANAAGRKLLNKGKKVGLTVLVSFTPTGGSTSTQGYRVTLRMAKKRH